MAKYKFNPLGKYLFDLAAKSVSGNDGEGSGTSSQASTTATDYLHDAHYNATGEELVITQGTYDAGIDHLNDASYIIESETLIIIPMSWQN